jgi:hypothetical protein
MRNIGGDVETHYSRCVELELAVDAAPLAAALSAERARAGVWEKRWYGRSATLYRDYPVQLQPPFLRITWQATLGASSFLEALRGRVEIAPAITVAEDFASLQQLPQDQQEKRLRDLIQRGQTIAAVYMARKLYGLDLTAATKFVKALSGETPS